MTRSSTQENDESDGGSQQGMYFSNEAAVGNEADDNESDDENGAAGFQFTKKGKKTLKICRHFSYTLITNAASMGWEDGEIAALILLVAGQLEFDEAKLVRCLDKTETGSPNVISHIVDDGKFSFTVPQLVSILLSYAKNVDHFITIMGDACECDMFDLTDAETIDVVCSAAHAYSPLVLLFLVITHPVIFSCSASWRTTWTTASRSVTRANSANTAQASASVARSCSSSPRA